MENFYERKKIFGNIILVEKIDQNCKKKLEKIFGRNNCKTKFIEENWKHNFYTEQKKRGPGAAISWIRRGRPWCPLPLGPGGCMSSEPRRRAMRREVSQAPPLASHPGTARRAWCSSRRGEPLLLPPLLLVQNSTSPGTCERHRRRCSWSFRSGLVIWIREKREERR